MEISKLFDNILDLPGIEGVCLFGTQGQMYVNRLPSFLSTELFADAQRRIVAMYETMDENFQPCDDYMLKFSERWLLLRRTDKHVMLILAGDKVNLASTRMVTNMTMKHLTPTLIAQLEAAAKGGLALVAVVTPVVVAPPAATRAPFAQAAAGSTPPMAKSAITAAPFQAVNAAPAKPVVAPAVAPVTAVVAEPVRATTVRMYRGRPY